MLNFVYEYIGNILKCFISSNIIVQLVLSCKQSTSQILLSDLFFCEKINRKCKDSFSNRWSVERYGTYTVYHLKGLYSLNKQRYEELLWKEEFKSKSYSSFYLKKSQIFYKLFKRFMHLRYKISQKIVNKLVIDCFLCYILRYHLDKVFFKYYLFAWLIFYLTFLSFPKLKYQACLQKPGKRFCLKKRLVNLFK